MRSLRHPALHLTLAVAACVISSAAAQDGPAARKAAAERLMETVRTLSGPDFEGREAGTPGGAKARRWIAERFSSIGLQPLAGTFEHPFSFQPGSRESTGARQEPLTGVNLVGVCRANDPDAPYIVVSAHYDHLGVRNGATHPGADDNASGVAVLLDVAADCLARPFRHHLVVVAFDAEEAGLRGAQAFVDAPPVPRGRLVLNVNLDMVARGDRGELYVSGTSHYPALRPVLEPVAARAGVKVLFGHDSPDAGKDDWTEQSDHAAFHRAKIPFVYFGVEDHPDYHKPTDTPAKIDPAFFAAASETILAALRALDAGLRQD
jgi:Zn-dependent M28 family amino/carboxypeptidase